VTTLWHPLVPTSTRVLRDSVPTSLTLMDRCAARRRDDVTELLVVRSAELCSELACIYEQVDRLRGRVDIVFAHKVRLGAARVPALALTPRSTHEQSAPRVGACTRAAHDDH
jgi:hypothetical protein